MFALTLNTFVRFLHYYGALILIVLNFDYIEPHFALKFEFYFKFDVRGSVHHSIIHIKIPARCNSVSKFYFKFDVRGSVHHSIIHIKIPARCNSVSKFYFNFDVRGSVPHSIIHIKIPARCNSVSKFYFIFL